MGIINKLQARARENKDIQYQEIPDTSEEDVVIGRAEGHIIIEIRLRPSQVQKFQEDLEELCNKYLNIS